MVSRWWVVMWAFDVVVLLGLLIAGVLPAVWVSAAVLLFFVPEAIGLWRSGDELPPLTQVVRRYLPRAVVFVAIGAGAVWAGFVWSDRPHRVLISVLVGGVTAWMLDHFITTFDRPVGS